MGELSEKEMAVLRLCKRTGRVLDDEFRDEPGYRDAFYGLIDKECLTILGLGAVKILPKGRAALKGTSKMTPLPYQVRVDGVVRAAFLDRREAESYRQNKCFRARESRDVDYYESDFVELHDVRTQRRLG